jgi:hypothetical protein
MLSRPRLLPRATACICSMRTSRYQRTCERCASLCCVTYREGQQGPASAIWGIFFRICIINCIVSYDIHAIFCRNLKALGDLSSKLAKPTKILIATQLCTLCSQRSAPVQSAQRGHKVSNRSLFLQNPGGAPGFEKKFLQLAAISVHRGMTEDRPIASLGTVVINLADFTDVKRGPKKLAFRVSVGREVTSALASIGKPEAPSLIVTMQCGPSIHDACYKVQPSPVARPMCACSGVLARNSCVLVSRQTWSVCTRTMLFTLMCTALQGCQEIGCKDLRQGNIILQLAGVPYHRGSVSIL